MERVLLNTNLWMLLVTLRSSYQNTNKKRSHIHDRVIDLDCPEESSMEAENDTFPTWWWHGHFFVLSYPMIVVNFQVKWCTLAWESMVIRGQTPQRLRSAHQVNNLDQQGFQPRVNVVFNEYKLMENTSISYSLNSCCGGRTKAGQTNLLLHVSPGK